MYRTCEPHAVRVRFLNLFGGINLQSKTLLQCVAVCCSVLQCVAECCRVLQCAEIETWCEAGKIGIFSRPFVEFVSCTAYCIWSVISSFSILNWWSSSLVGLIYRVLLKRDQGDWDWRLTLDDTPNALGCHVQVLCTQTEQSYSGLSGNRNHCDFFFGKRDMTHRVWVWHHYDWRDMTHWWAWHDVTYGWVYHTVTRWWGWCHVTHG